MRAVVRRASRGILSHDFCRNLNAPYVWPSRRLAQAKEISLLGRTKAFGGAGACFGGFGLAIALGSRRFQGVQQARGGAGDVVDGSLEGGLVGFGGLVEAGDFPDEL